MSKFEPAIKLLLKHEGGFVNNPNDAGGATSFGISIRFLQDQHLLGDFDHDGDVDVHDIAIMTVADATKIYKAVWWDKFGYENITDQTVATKVFDFAVNMGASRAHKLLQSALNKAFGLRLAVDGVIGPSTLKIINSVKDGGGEQVLITAYCDVAWQFYQSIIKANPSQQVFAKGWKNRAYAISKANSVV